MNIVIGLAVIGIVLFLVLYFGITWINKEARKMGVNAH